MIPQGKALGDLSPYEQGVLVARALESGLFPSFRRLVETVGMDAKSASQSFALAQLPSPVISAFRSPAELRLGMASKLKAALMLNPDFVLSRAKELAASEKKMSAQKVLKALKC